MDTSEYQSPMYSLIPGLICDQALLMMKTQNIYSMGLVQHSPLDIYLDSQINKMVNQTLTIYLLPTKLHGLQLVLYILKIL